MKFVCLGYFDEAAWDSWPEEERNSFMDKCLAYDDQLRQGAHFLGGEALQSVKSGVTLRYRNGQTEVTDGPFAETKEQLGGILLLEARDLNHAIQLMSKHPGLRAGPFEIRPADAATNALIEARSKR